MEKFVWSVHERERERGRENVSVSGRETSQTSRVRALGPGNSRYWVMFVRDTLRRWTVGDPGVSGADAYKPSNFQVPDKARPNGHLTGDNLMSRKKSSLLPMSSLPGFWVQGILFMNLSFPYSAPI